MNKVMKTAAAAVATLAIAGSSMMTPLNASAWWRSTGDYSTLKLDCDENGDNCQMRKCDDKGEGCEYSNYDTGNTPIFNSIINNPNYGDERKFVSAISTKDDIHGTWNSESEPITAQDGQEYYVRIYVHNNNQYGAVSNETKGTATGTRVAFSVPDVHGTAIEVGGWINSDNAKDKQVYSRVTFESADGRPFRMEYQDYAVLQNKGFAGTKGTTITDSAIVTNQTKDVKTGALIGYHGFDGKVPGCFKYDQIVVIKVKAVYTDFIIDKKVRVEGGKWSQTVDANIGDTVEFRIKYRNTSKQDHNRVIIRDIMPNNMVYVAGTTTLKNANHQEGIQVTPDGQLFTNGIEIGDYAPNNEAAVYFKAKIIDKDLECGKNALVNWGQGRANDRSLQDYAGVYATKVCANTVDKLPEAGPVITLGGAVAAGTIVTAAGYFIMSRRAMR